MSILKSISAATAAAAMIATPVAASAAPAAQALSVSNAIPARASAANQDESQASGAFIGVIAAVLIILGIVLLAGNDSDEAASA